MAAAVADFRPRAPTDAKLKKDHGVPHLDLEPTEDILSTLSTRRRPGQVLVGFAAEHDEDAVAYARGKLERKRLDAVVVNDIAKPGIGFDTADNEVALVLAGGEVRHIARARKDVIAAHVVDEVVQLRARKETSDRAVGADAPRPAGV
jgi:phosphopantothenoylcysteine decarboxylase/phosphopantothenate--cysteine ligase